MLLGAAIALFAVDNLAGQSGSGPGIFFLNPNWSTDDPGGTLIVNGAGYVTGSVVQLNGTALPTTYVSGTKLTTSISANLLATTNLLTNASSPPWANVTVMNPTGVVSNVAPLTIYPAITSLNPNSATAGDPGFTLTVNGRGYVTGSVVLWNDVWPPLPTTYVNGTKLTASISANLIANAGGNPWTHVTVINPHGGPGSNAAPFTIAAAAGIQLTCPANTGTQGVPYSSSLMATGGKTPYMYSITKGSLPTGLTLNAATGAISGTPTKSATSDFEATVLDSLKAGGSAACGIAVAAADRPDITGLSPNPVSAGSQDFILTVNGMGFVPGSVVQWNGTKLPDQRYDAGTLTARVPLNLVANPGTADVTVMNNPGGAVSTVKRITISPPPTITTINPSAAPAGNPSLASLKITVNGTGFVDGSVVQWNTAFPTALATTYDKTSNGTRLTAIVQGTTLSASPSDVKVVVINPVAAVSKTPATFTVIKMDSLQVKQPGTPNALDPTIRPASTQASTNASAAFAVATRDAEGWHDPADLVAVLLNSGTVIVRGINIQPAANANQVQWQMDRDPADKVNLGAAIGCAASPSGTPAVSGSRGAEVTFAPTNPGNFRFAAYVDLNGNGKFDDGEQLRILRVAVVRVTLIDPSSSTFTAIKDFVPTVSPSFATLGTKRPPGTPPMKLMGDYMIEGGGDKCGVGASKINIGNVGNLVLNTFMVNYPVPVPKPPAPGDVAGTATLNPLPDGGPLPFRVMIDTSRAPAGTDLKDLAGGDVAFRGNSMRDPEVASATGRRIRLTSFDAPQLPWRVRHLTTRNPWATAIGGIGFREFVVAFSASFPRTYSSLNENTWTMTLTGSNDGTGKWMDAGASVTGNAATLGAVTDDVQVLGLSAGSNPQFVYKP
jgi:hypothetical protein